MPLFSSHENPTSALSADSLFVRKSPLRTAVAVAAAEEAAVESFVLPSTRDNTGWEEEETSFSNLARGARDSSAPEVPLIAVPHETGRGGSLKFR